MTIRALLAVAPDDPKGLVAALAAGPDALILSEAGAAAEATSRLLAGTARRPRIFVRLSAADDGPDPDALRSLLPVEADGIVLTGCVGRRDVERLSARLAVHEAENDLLDGGILVLPCVGTAKGWVCLPSLPGASRRLCGLLWNEAELRADLGLAPRGPMPAPCCQVRAATILTARAAGVPAIDDAVPGDVRLAEVSEAAVSARHDGFSGKLATTPEQVAAILRAFA